MPLFDDAMLRAGAVWGSLFPGASATRGANVFARPFSSSSLQQSNPFSIYGGFGSGSRASSPFSPEGQANIWSQYAMKTSAAMASPVSTEMAPSAYLAEQGASMSNYAVPADFYPLIAQAAAATNLDPALIRAVMEAESGGQHYRDGRVTRSPAGALGLMGLMPDTARSLGVNPEDPAQNVMGGARYLAQMLDLFKGDVALALAAYNAGPGAVQAAGGIPAYEETLAYVSRVQELMDRYKGWKPEGYAPGPASNSLPLDQAKLVNKAQEIAAQGQPYVFGGGRNGIPGLDCSSFVSKIYREGLGRNLVPHTDTSFSQTVPAQGPVQVGDIVYFEFVDPSQPGVRFPHMGMVFSVAAGQVRVIHHTTYGGTNSTRIDDLGMLTRGLGARAHVRRLP